MATSYNGWPLSPPRSARLVPGTNVKLTVADGPAGDVLIYVADQFNRRVEPIVGPTPDDWSYSYRPNVNNPNTWSCHASATAIDLNALKHPNGASSTFSKAQFAEIDKILSEVSNVVTQLRGYDEMHFEISANATQVAAAAAKIRSGPPTAPVTDRPTLSKGDTGPNVQLLQRYLGVVPVTDPCYGTFGPATDAAVRTYQRSQGLDVDGVVGPRTWARIESGLNGSSSGTSGAPSTGRPTLQSGSSGSEVATLQAFLNRVFPAYSRLAVDGAFGSGTEAVVREFQRRSGIPDDGVVGPTTWARLGF